MSVFGAIKDAIFGKDNDDAPSAAPAPQPTAAPTATAAPVSAPVAKPAPSAESINSVLAERAAARGEPLNYQTSIVDLMKALGLDSSPENRRKLATELGYTGDQHDSATMNIWLHERVMARLIG